MRLKDLMGLTESALEIKVKEFEGRAGDSRESLERLRRLVAEYQSKFGITAGEMRAKLRAGDVEETEDLCDWMIADDLLSQHVA